MIQWKFTPQKIWTEFIILVFLLAFGAYSLSSVMKSNKELLDLKLAEMKLEDDFHSKMNRAMISQTTILKRNAIKLGVPVEELDKILDEDPIYRERNKAK